MANEERELDTTATSPNELHLNGLNRRQFLVRSAVMGLSASALMLFLDACTAADTATTTSPGSGTLPPSPTPHAAATVRPTSTSFPTSTPNPTPALTATFVTDDAFADLASLIDHPGPKGERIRIGHLLRRAGFGASYEELDNFTALGVPATVDYLLEYESVDDSSLEEFLTSLTLDLERLRDLQRWALLRMIYTKRPLQEKMVLFWHGLLTSGFKKVGPGPYMSNQNQLFRVNALGQFDIILKAVSRDPAMLIWLDSRVNKKASPNENFARELMELFSMGIGNYSETDVRESARAFTGWGLQKKAFYFRANLHDNGIKTFLGQTGNFNGDDIVDIIMQQPVTAEFITRKLFEFFVYDNPSNNTVADLAATLRTNNYNIKAVMRQILTSAEFYSARAYRAKIKSPTELVAGTIRSLGIETDGNPLLHLSDGMGQVLFNPFDVSGWPGGAAWVNSSTILQRINFGNLVATARRRTFNFDPFQEIARQGITTAEGAVDFFLSVLLDGNIPSQERNILLTYAQSLHNLNRATGTLSPTQDESLRGLVYLVLSSSDYQVA
jgi:hypothetical protein